MLGLFVLILTAEVAVARTIPIMNLVTRQTITPTDGCVSACAPLGDATLDSDGTPASGCTSAIVKDYAECYDCMVAEGVVTQSIAQETVDGIVSDCTDAGFPVNGATVSGGSGGGSTGTGTGSGTGTSVGGEVGGTGTASTAKSTATAAGSSGSSSSSSGSSSGSSGSSSSSSDSNSGSSSSGSGNGIGSGSGFKSNGGLRISAEYLTLPFISLLSTLFIMRNL
ncbi:hypothetical protein B0H19DRAFT_1259800 [Mycena capillaripes]|nr:hypothetical protein B0H19DRAFT_1259800 [Mycena capillaripes]